MPQSNQPPAAPVPGLPPLPEREAEKQRVEEIWKRVRKLWPRDPFSSHREDAPEGIL